LQKGQQQVVPVVRKVGKTGAAQLFGYASRYCSIEFFAEDWVA
jgi:hypothetical protein